MAEFGVVVDTCVLYGMPVADTMMLAAYHRLYKMYWSQDIIRELERTMCKKEHSQDEIQRRILAMTGAFRETEVTDYASYIPAVSLKDEDDRHVVAAALRKEAEVIVTYNLKHFPQKALSTFQHKVRAEHPDAFLRDLLDMHPEGMLNVLGHQAEKIKISFDDVLLNLEDHVPRFVAETRLLLEQMQDLGVVLPDLQPSDGSVVIPIERGRRRRAGRSQ